jgi:hypothetical protein
VVKWRPPTIARSRIEGFHTRGGEPPPRATGPGLLSRRFNPAFYGPCRQRERLQVACRRGQIHVGRAKLELACGLLYPACQASGGTREFDSRPSGCSRPNACRRLQIEPD